MYLVTSSVQIEEPSTTQDLFGDDVDTFSVNSGGVGVHIAERNRSVYDPTSGRWLTVRYYEGLFPASKPIDKGWRVTDEYLGARYQVDHVHEPANPVIPRSVRRVEMTKIE